MIFLFPTAQMYITRTRTRILTYTYPYPHNAYIQIWQTIVAAARSSYTDVAASGASDTASINEKKKNDTAFTDEVEKTKKKKRAR